MPSLYRRRQSSTSAGSGLRAFVRSDGVEAFELLDDDSDRELDPDTGVDDLGLDEEVFLPSEPPSTASGRTTPFSEENWDFDAQADDDVAPNSVALDEAPTVADAQVTEWFDERVQSSVEMGDPTHKITRQVKVQALERVSGLPFFHPIPHVPTAFVFDFRDSAYDMLLNVLNDKRTLTADVLILDKVLNSCGALVSYRELVTDSFFEHHRTRTRGKELPEGNQTARQKFPGVCLGWRWTG